VRLLSVSPGNDNDKLFRFESDRDQALFDRGPSISPSLSRPHAPGQEDRGTRVFCQKALRK